MIVTVKNEVNEPVVRQRIHRNKCLRGPSRQYKRQDKNRFFGPEVWAIINTHSPRAQFLSTHRSVRLHGSSNLYQQSPIALEHAPIRFAFRGAFQWGRISCSFFISTAGHRILSVFISTTDRRIARATLERARARASSHERAAELGTFVSFFFFRLYTKLKHDHNRTTIHDFNLHQ